MKAVKASKADDYLPPCPHTNRRKLSYRTKAEARRAARSGVFKGNDAVHVYRCPYCNWWHLTSQEQRPGG